MSTKPTTTKPRPKVKAAASTTGAVTVLAFVLRLLGVHVDDVPPEVLVVVAGALTTLAAYIRRDGLTGAWQRIVTGGDPS